MPHVCWLEDEVTYLRAENAKLQDALLISRGLPTPGTAPGVLPKPPRPSPLRQLRDLEAKRTEDWLDQFDTLRRVSE